MPAICEVYERVTGMNVYERSPYSGKLVFAAFSGSHQDAIAKGMNWRKEKSCEHWTVPYLPIDPKDVGREYETDVIRINSQSGKGGIGYLLEHNFGLVLPAKMRETVGYAIKHVSDVGHKELTPAEVHDSFMKEFVNVNAPIELVDYHFVRSPEVKVMLTVKVNGEEKELTAKGNGRLDAVSNAIKNNLGIEYTNLTYNEHALTEGSSSQAICYVGITLPDGTASWGAGVDSDIILASVKALFSAVNNSMK